MSKITGRPRKAITREKFVGFYVTNTQYFIIQQKVAMAGVNISDYMRQLAIYGKVKARWTAEEREIFKRMVSISNDLHQLVAVARQEGASSVLLHFERYRQLIDDVIKRLSDVK